MLKTQIDNLIQFCFMFHPSMSNWKEQSPDYIKEKWDKYIGIDLTNTCDDKSYYHNTSNWIKTWNLKDEDFLKIKGIIRFIISLSEKPILVRHQTQFQGKIEIWTLCEIIENFENQISPVNKITDIRYNSTHELINIEIRNWLSITQNNRDYNLYRILE